MQRVVKIMCGCFITASGAVAGLFVTVAFVAAASLVKDAGVPVPRAAEIAVFSIASIWPVLGIFAAWSIVLREPDPRSCRQCRYDLRWCTSNCCPECGERVSRVGRHEPVPEHSRPDSQGAG